MVYTKKLRLNNILHKLPKGSGFLVAYSGGSDSTALLYLFSELKNVRAIHINHGLHKDADLWQQHCQTTCDKLNIPLITEKFTLPDRSENTCRNARYKSFKKHLNKNETLLTAHHAGDQAETILLKLLRGTGLNGISGMEEFKTYHQGFLARVLLKYSANDLKEYLKERHISWIEDDSNENNNYRRNYLRNEIIPSLEKLWPNAIENICRTANNIQKSDLLLKHYTDFQTKHLAIDKLNSIPAPLQSTLFYHWLGNKNLPVPDTKTIRQICHSFLSADNDKNPHYKNNFYQIMRWKQALYCIKNYDIIDPKHSFTWNTKTTFKLPNQAGTIQYTGQEGLDLVIKFNQTGQKLKPVESKHTKTVKNLFQENNIPPWQKHNTPFIYRDAQLISLGSLWSAVDDEALNINATFEDLLI